MEEKCLEQVTTRPKHPSPGQGFEKVQRADSSTSARQRLRPVASVSHILATFTYPEVMPTMQPWRENSNRVSRDELLGTVVCHINRDPATEPLRAVLRWTCVSCAELWALARRLGLPDTSVANKAPYFTQAMAHPDQAVKLETCMERHLAARRAGVLSIPYVSNRRRPHFRTRAPGVGFVVFSNIVLAWWLLTASF